MDVDTASAIQAVAAAVSALTALGLGWLTVSQARERRAERDRDLQHEQINRIVDAIGALRKRIAENSGNAQDFEVARAELGAAIALRPVDLPACRQLLSDTMPTPPYGLGTNVHVFVDAALLELRSYYANV